MEITDPNIKLSSHGIGTVAQKAEATWLKVHKARARLDSGLPDHTSRVLKCNPLPLFGTHTEGWKMEMFPAKEPQNEALIFLM